MLKYLPLCCAAIAFLLGSTGLQAQDKIDYIYLLNGEEIKAEVESIQGHYIRYTPFEQPDTTYLRVAKTEIDRVKMADGTELWYNRLPKEAKLEESAAAPEAEKERKKKRPVRSQKLQRHR